MHYRFLRRLVPTSLFSSRALTADRLGAERSGSPLVRKAPPASPRSGALATSAGWCAWDRRRRVNYELRPGLTEARLERLRRRGQRASIAKPSPAECR